MALTPELYEAPASRLDAFVARWVQPTQQWKEAVLGAGGVVETFLREQRFQGEQGQDQEVRMLKVVKVSLQPSTPGQHGGPGHAPVPGSQDRPPAATTPPTHTHHFPWAHEPTKKANSLTSESISLLNPEGSGRTSFLYLLLLLLFVVSLGPHLAASWSYS